MTRGPYLFLVSLLLVACAGEPVKSPVKQVPVQNSAPIAKSYALEAPEVSDAEELSSGFQDVLRLGESQVGEEVLLSDYSGSVLLVSYWSSQCADCWGQILDLQRIYDVYQQRGLAVALINRGEEQQVVNEYIMAKEQVLTVDLLLDRHGRASATLDILDLPAAILYDRDGSETARYTGGIDFDLVQQNLDELLHDQ